MHTDQLVHATIHNREEIWRGWESGHVRFGKVVLEDVEEAPRNELESPELGKPNALKVDDDERLATSSEGDGWEGIGKESLPHC